MLCITIYAGVHVTLESLVKDKELVSIIKDLVRGSGRSHPPLGEPDAQVNQETVGEIVEKQQPSGERIPISKQLSGVPRKEDLCILKSPRAIHEV
uniref:Uncharacterized protein n=1 Tax=Rhizophora mucronata TaxID=61149 RepID=A0A2P2MKZ0_RHIMU